MLAELKSQVARGLQAAIRELFGVEHEPIVEVPPKRELGDLAFPGALQLARTVRRPPRQIAEAILAAYEPPDMVERVEVAGAGYLNLFLRRSAAAARLLERPVLPAPAAGRGKVIVEHTNINPNKAAHIGHLRNAVLGDVLVRTLRSLGYPVEVQNYIDDTGVQLADVVVGFVDLRGLDLEAVAALPEPFDFTCWDLYSEVGRWYEADEARRVHRRETLHAMEIGQGERAAMGRLVARRIVRRHLGTMRRIGIGYDLLTRESDILGERFFEVAFGRLKDHGAVRHETEGKNAGCWVMPLAQSEEFAGLEDPDKVIVRSDGTVTYVGKDIAYQLWKFGLLGKDFHYRRWEEEGVWETGPAEAPGTTGGSHPSFGGAARAINVIDARQSYLQKIVRAGLETLGHHGEAERSVHFAYEMVALSTDTARQLGYLGAAGDAAAEGTSGAGTGKTLEMSGRKGIGVKADDLLDQLEARAREEIVQREREVPAGDVERLARDIATAAIRFLMVKATTNRVIAFDLDEALAFEGETGPYLQYSSVRPRNIRRRLAAAGLADDVAADEAAALPAAVWSDDLWDLVLAVADSGEVVEKAGETLELSLLARHALDLAQRFNALYNRHPILQEEDAALRTARLAATRIYQRGLEALAELLGIPLPEAM
ncbi:MAG TPA: arginine--tRNA ligase [Thermoanaerobaculia bacterium]|nr:arginine--tRNA ligase [Thermoanaerobaculia bacterium]